MTKLAFFPYTKIKTKVFFWITRNQVDTWSRKTNIFFVLAHGRSGTAFLANLLNRARGARVFHEPVIDDFRAYVDAFYNPEKAIKYFNAFRKKEIYLRMHNLTLETYGEVNSVLRRHAQAIQQTFPDATLVHLVRDGREVVRSMYSRKTMTQHDPVTKFILPGKSDPYLRKWGEMDRFAQLCWYWMVENSYLRKNIGRTLLFEKALSSYDYLQENLLEPCKIQLTKNTWADNIKVPENVTSVYQMPRWPDWSNEQKCIFEEICGDEMKHYGYPL